MAMRKRFLVLATVLVALNLFFWLAATGFALPQSIISDFFGARMVRAEVLVAGPGGTQDYLLDQGVITQVSSASVTLRERDGSFDTIPLDPNAQVRAGAQTGTAAQLRRRMRVIVIRQANAPATIVQVLGFS